jgi:hypothetical protein
MLSSSLYRTSGQKAIQGSKRAKMQEGKAAKEQQESKNAREQSGKRTAREQKCKRAKRQYRKAAKEDEEEECEEKQQGSKTAEREQKNNAVRKFKMVKRRIGTEKRIGGRSCKIRSTMNPCPCIVINSTTFPPPILSHFAFSHPIFFIPCSFALLISCSFALLISCSLDLLLLCLLADLIYLSHHTQGVPHVHCSPLGFDQYISIVGVEGIQVRVQQEQEKDQGTWRLF